MPVSSYNHCSEFLRWPATEKYKKDHNQLKPIVDLLSTVPGYVGNGYTGLENEDGNTGYFITNWTSYPVHQQLYGSKYEDELKKLLPAITTGELTVYHVYLNRSHAAAASKPVTEFVEFTLKQGVDQKAALAAMKKLWVWLDTNHPIDGTYGPFVEDVNHYLFIIGWNTVDEIHQKGPPKDIIGEVVKYYDHAGKSVNLSVPQ